LFHIAKIIGFFLQPSSLLLVLLLIACALLWSRFWNAGRWVVVAGTVLLLVGGLLPTATWLILPLEERFHRPELGNANVDGILVLGGGEDSRVAKARNVHALNEAGERLTEGLALARRYPKAKLVFTGGSIEILFAPTVGAEAASRILQDFDLGDPRRIVLEAKARNTWENAVFTKELVKPKSGERWLLVTSAAHMPRAMGVFRKAGFPVEPWPVDYRTAGARDRWLPFEAPSEGLRRLEAALHEWYGLIAYRVLGRTDALLPAP
jgi:uncharacterized SAM-binding protein YcdF (DUF218 family)